MRLLLILLFTGTSLFAQEIDSNDITKSFITNLEKAITTKTINNDLLLTSEVFISIAPEDEQKNMRNELEAINEMSDNWRQSFISFIDGLKKYKDVKVSSSKFILRSSQHNAKSYSVLLSLLCDSSEVKYQLLALEAKENMYLKLIRKI